jgi:hypothetical protein
LFYFQKSQYLQLKEDIAKHYSEKYHIKLVISELSEGQNCIMEVNQGEFCRVQITKVIIEDEFILVVNVDTGRCIQAEDAQLYDADVRFYKFPFRVCN